MRRTLLFIAFLISLNVQAQTGIKVLFDARHAQMAANADWVVDADNFNIGTGTGGAMTTGAGNEANPQRYPTPAQSGITSSTSETYWKGGNSAWAVALVKKGYLIESLPYNGSLTFGVTTNAQDLANYKVFICNEPNIRFTTAEKQAIIRFVQNGGGLFIISDHTVSDRNNDTWDSPAIWNDLFTNNGLVTNPFGISFDLLDFSETTTNFASLSTNTTLHGTFGNPTRMKFSNGTSMTLNKTVNPNALGLVFRTGYSNTGSTGVMLCTSKYGTGKVVGLGDSSPPDDGTGDLNDVIYNGWTGDVSGDHQRIIMNATIWLSNSLAARTDDPDNNFSGAFEMFPNPASNTFNLGFFAKEHFHFTMNVYDMIGKKLISQAYDANDGYNQMSVDISDLRNGSYFVELISENGRKTAKLIKSGN